MKTINTIILFIFIFLILTRNTYADKIAGNSAVMTYNVNLNEKDKELFIKKLAIKKVLSKYSSPLADSSDSFIITCSTFDLDCYLLPSIAGLESTFGKFIYPNSYNPFGWGGGYIMFSSWDEGIHEVGKGLRENYLSKGVKSIEEIAPIYSESATWAPRVRYFMNQFQKEEDKLQLYLSENTVKL